MLPMAVKLKKLPVEPWGSRFRRARLHIAGLRNLDDAVELIAEYQETSSATLSRLETRPDAPADRGGRKVAYIACRVYGVQPAQLELTADDVPPMILRALEEFPPNSAWNTAVNLALVAA
jgi:hypothetical protein